MIYELQTCTRPRANLRAGIPAIAAVLGLICATPAAAAAVEPDPPKVCDSCEAWNLPHEPFRVFGNTWYVGVAGLSSILIASKDGAILIDGGLTQSAPLIAANIRKLGFRVEDIKLIMNSHTHYDHAGGIAALQRASHAQVAASPAAKRALESGGPTDDDPQFGFGPEHNSFPAVRDVRVVADGETLRVGKLAITAHFTPGHTPGGTTWTWRSCERKHCIDIVYADSLNSISAPGFRFTGDATHASRLAVFERSIATVAALPCDLLLAPHPEMIGLDTKFAALTQDPANNPFIDPAACRNYAAGARERLEQRIAAENATDGAAAYGAGDTAGLNAVADHWREYWNAHDMENFAGLFADDVDFVTKSGSWFKGKQATMEHHRKNHTSVFKDSTWTTDQVVIKYVKPDVAIIHIGWGLSGDSHHDGTASAPRHGLSTWVLTKRDGQWLLLAVQNVNIETPQ